MKLPVSNGRCSAMLASPISFVAAGEMPVRSVDSTGRGSKIVRLDAFFSGLAIMVIATIAGIGYGMGGTIEVDCCRHSGSLCPQYASHRNFVYVAMVR